MTEPIDEELKDLERAGIRIRPPTILIAEDDPEMRTMLACTFKEAGYDVIEAENGVQVLDYLGSSRLHGHLVKIDLLITDVRMPGVDGLHILGDLRSYDRQIPVVLITAFGSPELHSEANRLGATAVLDKPFDFTHLQTVVCSLLPLTPLG
jgi:CheY-like chemotaxis protein